MKLQKIVAILLAAVLLLGLVLTAFAESSAQIREQIDALEEEQIKNQEQMDAIEAELNANWESIEQMAAYKNQLDQQIFLLYSQVENLNEQIAGYTALIAETQAELDDAQGRLEVLNDKYKERIRAMEEAGNLSYWSVIFKSSSFTDLLDRLNLIREIAEADQRMLDELRAAAAEVAAAKEQLVAEKEGLEEARLGLEEAQAELEAKSAEADAVLAELYSDHQVMESLHAEALEVNNALADEIAAAEMEFTAALKAEEEERRRQEEEERRRQEEEEERRRQEEAARQEEERRQQEEEERRRQEEEERRQEEEAAREEQDNNASDSGSPDSGSTDSGSTDSGSTDSGSSDSGSSDSGSSDSGSTDSGSSDSGSSDSGSTDSGSSDSGSTDSGSSDSGSSDSGSSDSGSSDSGSSDSGSTESGWIIPCSYRYISSSYGYRASGWHNGVDFVAYRGTPIYASRSGIVTTAKALKNAAGQYISYGNYVVVNHGDGYSSLYAHMDYFVVSAGTYVTQGQLIGYVGSTGNSTGDHLHFTVFYNGSTVNPMSVLP